VFNLTQGSPFTSGELICLYITAHSKYLFFPTPPHTPFWSGVSVTADFPVNWSQCHRPSNQPIFEGAVLESLSLLRRMPLKSRPRWGHYLFEFLRTQRVPRFAFLPVVFLFSRTEGKSFPRLEVELNGCVGNVEEDHLVLPQASPRCQIEFCTQRTLINVQNIQFFWLRLLPQSDM